MEMYDYNGKPVTHKFASVNGIRMHYVTAGQGPVILLLHGTPKTNYYWCDVMPLLTKDFTVVAPDLRGFGYTDKPGASEGYDSLTVTKDLDEAVTRYKNTDNLLESIERKLNKVQSKKD